MSIPMRTVVFKAPADLYEKYAAYAASDDRTVSYMLRKDMERTVESEKAPVGTGTSSDDPAFGEPTRDESYR